MMQRKKRSEIIKNYDLTSSTFDKWVKQSKTTGSFKTVDKLTADSGIFNTDAFPWKGKRKPNGKTEKTWQTSFS